MDRRIKQAWVVFTCAQILNLLVLSVALGAFIVSGNVVAVAALAVGFAYFVVEFRRTLRFL